MLCIVITVWITFLIGAGLLLSLGNCLCRTKFIQESARGAIARSRVNSSFFEHRRLIIFVTEVFIQCSLQFRMENTNIDGHV